MPERVPKCPNCGANLRVGRHDLITTCPFCLSTVRLDPDLVETARFKEAYAAWTDPARVSRSWTTIGDRPYVMGPQVAHGEVGTVYAAALARSPSEAVFVRIVRDPAHAPRIEQAARALRRLRESKARGASMLARRVPELVFAGAVQAGQGLGRAAIVTRIPHGFPKTLAELGTIDAVASVWVWRRILEVLSVMHETGLAHGALTPAHVLVEAGEHGARLVGFGNADSLGAPRSGTDPRWAALYPSGRVDAESDVQMSARLIQSLVRNAPDPYATLLASAAAGAEGGAWNLRDTVGRVAFDCFGRPRYCPLLPR